MLGRIQSSYDANNRFSSSTLLGQLQNQFKYGRLTSKTCIDSTYLMPSTHQGCDSTQDIFNNNIFSSKPADQATKLTSALLGVHTIGKAKSSNSGYSGAFSDNANQGKLNNAFFKSTLTSGWAPD